MSNILINGLKAKTGGGKTILNNYMSLLKGADVKHRYFILTPEKREYEKYSSTCIEIVEIPGVFERNALFPLLYRVVMPWLLRFYKIDAVLNLGDIVIPTSIPQLYLFDWPYAVYPNSVVWSRMDAKSYLTRRVKLFVFKRWIKNVTTVIAQTETMKGKLESLYALKNVEVVPNAVPLENMTGGSFFDFDLPKNKIKFLYLTYYYSHKNLELFLPLARRIKENSLPYCIVVTIDSKQHSRAKRFLNSIKNERLDDVIINVRPVAMDAVPSLYDQCDALLMPTLLESFSATYVEAMFHRKTILTSNLDFAKDVCGQSAFYFDPLDPDSVLSAIQRAFEDTDERTRRIEEGRKRLDRLLSWNEVFAKCQTLLENVLQAR